LSKKPFIIACVPAYNEERTIAQVIIKTMKHVDKVIVCDDGSKDMTGEIAGHLGAEVVYHEKNEGYGASLRSLFNRARELDANVVVTLDADGQHNPSEIPLLIEPVLDGKADVVVGSRFLGDSEKRNNVPRYRRMGIRMITGLTDATSKNGVSDAQSGFRAYSQKALDNLKLNENGMGISVEVLMEAKKQGLTVVEVPTSCNYHGTEKTSTHNPLRHGISVVMSIVRLVVEDRPLMFLGMPGVLSLLIGVFFGVWMLEIYTTEHYIVTNIALASLTFILIGFFAISTAITLYAIIRITEKLNSKD